MHVHTLGNSELTNPVTYHLGTVGWNPGTRSQVGCSGYLIGLKHYGGGGAPARCQSQRQHQT